MKLFVFALKQIIDYYQSLHGPVYIYFVNAIDLIIGSCLISY
jgi:hypothetical protein